MKQGTLSVLFGCHSFVHCTIVLMEWIKLYHRMPKLWQIACIYLHDIGHWGKDYLDDYELKKHHHELGAKVCRYLFGQKGKQLEGYEATPCGLGGLGGVRAHGR